MLGRAEGETCCRKVVAEGEMNHVRSKNIYSYYVLGRPTGRREGASSHLPPGLSLGNKKKSKKISFHPPLRIHELAGAIAREFR